MKKKWRLSIFISLFMLLFAYGCQEQDLVLEPELSNGSTSLSKQAWSIVSQNWPNHRSSHECLKWTWTNPDDYIYVTNQEYDFQFVVTSEPMSAYGSDGIPYFSVIVKVNGTHVTTLPIKGYGYYHDSFTFEGRSMYASITSIVERNVNTCYIGGDDIPKFLRYPIVAETRVFGYVDIPSGFSVSPTAHNNLNQNVSISWNASSDTDVTGYQIWRHLQTDPYPSYYTLIKTITSRTTTSWLDTNVPWSESNPEMTLAQYKMRAVDGTHSLYSSYTIVRASLLP